MAKDKTIQKIDATIIGLGAHGETAAVLLTDEGKKVYGRDKGSEPDTAAFYENPHSASTNRGRRLCRVVPDDHPDKQQEYIKETLDLMRKLERYMREKHDPNYTFIHPAPAITIGPKNSKTIAELHSIAAKYCIRHEILNAEKLKEKYGITIESNQMAFVELAETAYNIHPGKYLKAAATYVRDHGSVLEYNSDPVDFDALVHTDYSEPKTPLNAFRKTFAFEGKDGTSYQSEKLLLTIGEHPGKHQSTPKEPNKEKDFLELQGKKSENHITRLFRELREQNRYETYLNENVFFAADNPLPMVSIDLLTDDDVYEAVVYPDGWTDDDPPQQRWRYGNFNLDNPITTKPYKTGTDHFSVNLNTLHKGRNAIAKLFGAKRFFGTEQYKDIPPIQTIAHEYSINNSFLPLIDHARQYGPIYNVQDRAKFYHNLLDENTKQLQTTREELAATIHSYKETSQRVMRYEYEPSLLNNTEEHKKYTQALNARNDLLLEISVMREMRQQRRDSIKRCEKKLRDIEKSPEDKYTVHISLPENCVSGENEVVIFAGGNATSLKSVVGAAKVAVDMLLGREIDHKTQYPHSLEHLETGTMQPNVFYVNYRSQLLREEQEKRDALRERYTKIKDAMELPPALRHSYLRWNHEVNKSFAA